MSKQIAIYLRVSTAKQDTRSQKPELERWANAQELPVVWFADSASGKSMDRPGWNKLEQAIKQGKVATLCVWRLDRLGRTASGLTALFDELRAKKVNLVSVKDGLDLSTAAGRLMANVLASIASYETELRGERVLAGQAVAKAHGKTWGGSKAGRFRKHVAGVAEVITQWKAEGKSVTEISEKLKISRPTIYSVLRAAGNRTESPQNATSAEPV